MYTFRMSGGEGLNELWSSVEVLVTLRAQAEGLRHDPEAVQNAMHVAAARIAEHNRALPAAWTTWEARRTYVQAKQAKLALNELRGQGASDELRSEGA